MKKKHNFSTTPLLILIFFAGLSLLLYPTVSDYWNSFTQSKAIASYAEDVARLDEKDYSHLWEAAQEHNRELNERTNHYRLSEEQKLEYSELLNISGSGIMGQVEIPEIGCSLPIYHGVDEAVLQIAIGHLDWTSLPVGGESTHCVISGHRGLPSAKLFTNLDELVVGDIFMLRVLDEVLTYEVDQILIVEPHETDALLIEEGKDLCTLVTCTPYGINSHRLLVRGSRILDGKPTSGTVILTDEIEEINLVYVIPVALILLVVLGLTGMGVTAVIQSSSATTSTMRASTSTFTTLLSPPPKKSTKYANSTSQQDITTTRET